MRKLASFFCVAVFVFVSCDIGLGEKVDTTAPSVAITYPPASAVVRGAFVLAGTSSDDKKVDSVSVKVSRTNNDFDCGTFTTTVEKNGNWKISLNERTQDGSYPFPDGKYSLEVTARDDSGRKSSVASRAFEIDNSAPVFIINSPGVVKMEDASTFGQTFKVSGTIADDHDIAYMNLTVYDSNKKQLAHWSEPQINTAGGTSVKFARFLQIDDPAYDYLAKNYDAVYDDSSTASTELYCTVEIIDSAKEYAEPVYDADAAISNTTSGNTTTNVYLYNDIYESLMSKTSEWQLEAGEIKRILNGTYGTYGNSYNDDLDEASLASIRKILKSTTDTSKAEKLLAFKLNKNAAPSYKIFGYSYADGDTAKDAQAEGTVTFSANCGYDGTLFNTNGINVYLFGPFSGSEIIPSVLNTIYANPAAYAAAAPEKLHALLLEADDSADAKNEEIFNQALKLPDDIAASLHFIIAASGTDADGNEFQNEDGTYFVLKGISTGEKPTLTFKDSNGKVTIEDKEQYRVIGYTDGNGTFYPGLFYGTMTCAGGTDVCQDVKVSVTITEKESDSSAQQKNFSWYVADDDLVSGSFQKKDLTGNVTQAGEKSVAFKINLHGNSELDTYLNAHESIWRMYILLTGTDSAGASGEASVTVQKDNVAPVFGTLLTDTSGWKTSTALELKVNVNDTSADGSMYSSGIEGVLYSTTGFAAGDDGTALAVGKLCDASGSTTASVKKYYIYNTTAQLSEGVNNITFRAVDNMGNKNEKSASYKIDATAPKVTLASVADGAAFPPSFVTSTLGIKYTISDLLADETIAVSGIKELRIGKKSGFADSESLSITPDGGSATKVISFADETYSVDAKTLSVDLSSLTEGANSIYVRVTDNAGNATETLVGPFTVDRTAPSVTYTAPKNGATGVNGVITLSGKVADSNLASDAKPALYEVTVSGGTKTFTAITDNGTITAADGGEWSITGFDTKKLSDGSHSFQVRFTDKAGNTTADDATLYSFTVNQDSDRPVVSVSGLTAASGSITANSTLRVSASDDDGDLAGLWFINKTSYDGAKLPTVINNNTWTKIDLAGESTIDISGFADGEHTLYFYAIDAAGTAFHTLGADTASGKPALRPYIQIGGTKADNKVGVSFIKDTTAPNATLSISHGTASQSDGDWSSEGGDVFGPTSYMYLKLEAVEPNGMNGTAPVALQIGGKSVELDSSKTTEETTSEGTTYTYYSKAFSLATLGNGVSGSVNVSATVKDKAGNETKEILNLVLDNKAPTVSIISPTTNRSDAITGAITIKGIVQDNSSTVSRLRYLIPSKSEASGITKASSGWVDLGGTSASWEIVFTSSAKGSADSILTYANETYADEAYPDIYKVPIYFDVADSVGNEAILKDLYVLVDSESGNPTAWINTPSDGETTSGKITVYGGALDIDGSVSEVQVQIDNRSSAAAFNTSYNTTILSDWAGTVVSENLATASDGAWYIKATGTSSWKLEVDTGKLAEYNGHTYIRLRVRAIDDGGNFRAWTEPVCVTIDPNAPLISGLKVVQYGAGKSSGTAITEQEYSAGMYLSNATVSTNGDYYLTGTISDDEKVSSVVFTRSGSIILDWADKNPNTTPYSLNEKIATSTNGSISYRITALDDNGNKAETTVEINIDSTAPAMYTTAGSESESVGSALRLTSRSKTIGTESNSAVVENSNGYFTFGDTVVENGSGLKYVVFWFERNNSAETNKRVLDPLISKTPYTVGSVKANGSVYVNAEDLPALYVTGLTRDDEWSVRSDVLKNKTAIRKGGLIKIAGSYLLIDSYDSTTGKITFTTSVSTSFTEAEVIYGQVVDHQLTEGVASDGSITNDDGDGMVETIDKIGSNYKWTASIDSTNLADGPVTLHVIAFDNAGNMNKGSVETKVQNNRPRIAKVLLGTDLNGDGKYTYSANLDLTTELSKNKLSMEASENLSGTSFGEFVYYPTLSVTGESQYEVTLDSAAFKVVGGLMVIPEFTGGNDSLKYVLESTGTASATSERKTGTGSSLKALSSKSEVIAKVTNKNASYSIADQISDFGAAELTASGSSNTYYNLTFWDATEETTQGTNSQWALLRIPVTVRTDEADCPKTQITPFYWKNATDSSVYINGQISGHIELENDLPSGTFKTNNSGVYDIDPKVSGKVTVRAKATDDTRLEELTVSYGSTNNAPLAKYTGGSWVSQISGDVITDFTVINDDITQSGHTVEFTFVLNTEKIAATPVQVDYPIGVGAKDWKQNITAIAGTSAKITTTPHTGTVTTATVNQTSTTTNTPYYRMDVVPYVTGIKTHLTSFSKSERGKKYSEDDYYTSSAYARTALGKYPVYEGETIAFAGYNLGTNVAQVTVPGMGAVTLGQGQVAGKGNILNNTLTLTTSATSGELELLVNTIPALNNKNNNAAKGLYDNSDATDYDRYNNWYNRLPNNINNNTLTDNVELDVWQFKNAANPVSGGANYVTMKINPKTGVPGFSYANSILYFNMPAYQSDRSSYDENTKTAGNTTVSWSQLSQTPVGMNYGGFSHNTFAYDSYGYSYGAAMCTDTQSATASAYFQFFSREAPLPIATLDQNMNYHNQANASRLDSSSMNVTGDDTGWTTDIDRIQSPAMDTSLLNGAEPTDDSPTYVFMAYYDQPVKQVRFKWGTVGASTDAIDKTSAERGSSSTDSGSFSGTVTLRIPAEELDTDGETLGIWAWGYSGTAMSNYGSKNNIISKIFTKNGSYYEKTYNVSGGTLGVILTTHPNSSSDSTGKAGDESNQYITSPGVYYASKTVGNYWYTTDPRGAQGLNDVVDPQYTGKAQFNRSDGNNRQAKVMESLIKYGNPNVQVIAASGVSGARSEYASATEHAAGKYVALSIVNKDSSAPVAIVSWYDAVNMELCMAYNENPTSSNVWTTRVIDENGGINVKTVVDGDGGIHFAYYDNMNGSDLKYAYLSSYNAGTPQIATVDSYSSVGSKCTIDVAKDEKGNWVPYIGYQLGSYLGTPLAAKVAYRTNFDSFLDGADSDQFTGAWECSIIPTQNIPNDDLINVGVWRDSTGKAKVFNSDGNLDHWDNGGAYLFNSTMNVGAPSIVYGNNTANPIMGYGIDTGSIEMAQKK